MMILKNLELNFQNFLSWLFIFETGINFLLVFIFQNLSKLAYVVSVI